VGGEMAFATQRFPAVARVWPVVPGEVVPLELHPIARAPVSATNSPAESLLMVGLKRSMVMLLVEIKITEDARPGGLAKGRHQRCHPHYGLCEE
jgi:hypothetical protein